MITGLLGKKLSQTHMFTEEGKYIPVTKITVGPCNIIAIVTDGQNTRVQLSFDTKKAITRSIEGIVKKAGLTTKPRFLREFSVEGVKTEEIAVGKTISVTDVFAVGDKVNVTGTSKGKGFAGVVKRHHFKGGPRTHGQSDRERSPGSIGQTTTPGRVYRGKRMAGRLGGARATVTGLTVVAVDQATNSLIVKGLIPGAKNGLVEIHK